MAQAEQDVSRACMRALVGFVAARREWRGRQLLQPQARFSSALHVQTVALLSQGDLSLYPVRCLFVSERLLSSLPPEDSLNSDR